MNNITQPYFTAVFIFFWYVSLSTVNYLLHGTSLSTGYQPTVYANLFVLAERKTCPWPRERWNWWNFKLQRIVCQRGNATTDATFKKSTIYWKYRKIYQVLTGLTALRELWQGLECNGHPFVCKRFNIGKASSCVHAKGNVDIHLVWNHITPVLCFNKER